MIIEYKGRKPKVSPSAFIAPTAVVTGWSRLTDPLLHVVTPLVTLVVWAVWGPRGWITRREVPLALVIPLAWICWMLARGAVVGAYPYDFANVADLGYVPVATTLVPCQASAFNS